MKKYPFSPELLDALPEALAAQYRKLEETLLEVKNCFYSSVRKNIEDTYGPSCRVYTPDDEYKHLMEYKERDYWKMFDNMECKPLLHHLRPCKVG